MYKVLCKCAGCEKPISVDFVIQPSEEDKLGIYCDSCAKQADPDFEPVVEE